MAERAGRVVALDRLDRGVGRLLANIEQTIDDEVLKRQRIEFRSIRWSRSATVAGSRSRGS